MAGKCPNRYGCCTLDYANLPQSPPNLATFFVRGFYYRTLPEWYDADGVKLTPLQFSIINDEMTYKYAFYKPAIALSEMMWYMRTSEDIAPQIDEWVTLSKMKVRRLSTYNGYTTWEITV